MLKETWNTHDTNRRWFSDDYFDLIVWYDTDRRLIGFQLCYDMQGNEHAFTWREGTGTAHHRIDSGESSPLKNMTPVLVPVGAVPYNMLARQFRERAANIDADITALVLRKLSEESDEDGV